MGLQLTLSVKSLSALVETAGTFYKLRTGMQGNFLLEKTINFSELLVELHWINPNSPGVFANFQKI